MKDLRTVIVKCSHPDAIVVFITSATFVEVLFSRPFVSVCFSRITKNKGGFWEFADYGLEKSWLNFPSYPGYILDIVHIADLPVSRHNNDSRCYKISNEAAAFTFVF